MKRLVKILMLLAVVGLSLSAAQCRLPWFFGTWTWTDLSGSGTEAITIGATALRIVGTDMWEGELNATVDAHDETAGTVQATVTNSTLNYSSYAAGYVMYWLFAANATGQLFHLYNINSTYPTGDPVSTGVGPYVK